MQPILTIARFTLLEVHKNYLLLLVLFAVISASILAIFIAELTLIETTQTQLAIIASLLRLFTVLIICTFVITSMAREFNDKCLELIIALPIQRHTYLLGKMLGFFLLIILTTIMLCLPIAFIARPLPLLLWLLSLICELSILTAFSLLCLMTFKSMLSIVFSVTVFYLLARTISTIQLMISSPILQTNSLSHEMITLLINGIALLLPALDQFSKTEWLIYNIDNTEYLFTIGQTIIYTTLLLTAACLDLHRKNF